MSIPQLQSSVPIVECLCAPALPGCAPLTDPSVDVGSGSFIVDPSNMDALHELLSWAKGKGLESQPPPGPDRVFSGQTNARSADDSLTLARDPLSGNATPKKKRNRRKRSRETTSDSEVNSSNNFEN